MKKQILLLFLVMFSLSCQKEQYPKQCWECQITGSILGPQYNKVVEQCVERESDLDMDWQDPFNNDMNIYCKRK